nr:MAG TPA: hypothetical protein [Caudoviricetes sp.]
MEGPGLGAKVTCGTGVKSARKLGKLRREGIHWYTISLGPAPLDWV